MRVFAATPLRRPMAIYPMALDMEFQEIDSGGVPVKMVDDVAIVDIRGPLMQRACWFDGYDAILERFGGALESDAVGVVLRIGSPGGDAEGLFETARVMRQMASREGKPVCTYVDESAYSAAYALACVGDIIYLPPAGGVGSVGVIGELMDWTAMNRKMGLRVEVITSGEEKADGNPDVPLTDDVIARAQQRVDQLAGIFWGWVAMRRPMDVDEVIALEAGCYYGQAAIAAGLADVIRSFAGTIADVKKLALDKANGAAVAPAP